MGSKLDDEAEARVEARVAAGPATGAASGRIRKLEGALDDYLRELASAFDLDLSGRRIVLDCANGATYRAAPAAFERLGADLDDDRRRARRPQHQRGLRFDPPRQRRRAPSPSMAPRSASPSTATATGCSPSTPRAASSTATRSSRWRPSTCARPGELPGGVAVTVMSNYGFHQAMEAAGIEVATTKVGDRYVIEELVERGWTIGGEQSGHIIWTDFATTGDGLAAALLVDAGARRRAACGAPPDREAPAAPRERPGRRRRGALAAATGLWEAVGREGAGLEGRGRVLVRPSGTEPLVRVMVEAPDEAECEQVLGRLVAVARRELG